MRGGEEILMKTLLLVGGILLLLLGVVLFIIAVVMFLVGRGRAAKNAPPAQPHAPSPIPPAPVVPKAAAAPAPAPTPPPTPPPAPAPAAAPTPAPTPAPAPAADSDATIVAGGLGFGALHAISGKLSGQTFPLRMDGFYIGRDRALSQVVLDDASVSKRHVWVGVREGVPTAIDQSSTNGTYLNTLGTRIGQVRLSPGDTIIISDDVARFVYKA